MNIKQFVIECCQVVINENNVDLVVNENLEMSRECGFDSLGIVTIIMDIEEKLGIPLDDILFRIRRCKTVGELIEIIEETYNKQKH